MALAPASLEHESVPRLQTAPALNNNTTVDRYRSGWRLCENYGCRSYHSCRYVHMHRSSSLNFNLNRFNSNENQVRGLSSPDLITMQKPHLLEEEDHDYIYMRIFFAKPGKVHKGIRLKSSSS
jgi:hypothetical protein